MTDVGREAGVSQSAVSIALNDTPGRLPQETRERICEVARQLGYQVPVRRRLSGEADAATGRNVLAYVVDEISISPHAVLHVDGARDAAWTQDWTVQVHVTRGDGALENATLHAIVANPAVAGVIYASSFTREVEPPAALHALPSVLLNCYGRNRTYPALLPGEVAGGFAVTTHLLQHGHRRIGMIGGEPWMDASRDRLRGYKDALAAAAVPFVPSLVRDGDWSVISGQQHATILMRQCNPPTALFCASDLMALGAIDAVTELGIPMPSGVSVIGYNDLPVSRQLAMPLSTCRVPSYELGYRAAEMLVQHVSSGKPLRRSLTTLECQLVVRSPTTVAPNTRLQQDALQAKGSSDMS